MKIRGVTTKGCSKAAKYVVEKLAQKLEEIRKEKGLGAIRLRGEAQTAVCWTVSVRLVR